jgi:hypothetical protein
VEHQRLTSGQLAYVLENLQQQSRAVSLARTADDRLIAAEALQAAVTTADEVLKRLAQQGTESDLAMLGLHHDLTAHHALGRAILERIQRRR